MTGRRLRGPLLALATAALTSGCLLFAGGAAAGSGIYLTTRGAEAVVHGDLEAVSEAARGALAELDVEYQGFRDADDGESRDIFGATEDADVTVAIHRRTDNATGVEVRVKTSAVTWDKEMAKTILEEIRERREE